MALIPARHALIPAWLRHALIVSVSAAAGVVLQAVVDAHGVTGVPWPETLASALDTGAAAAAAGLLLLVATPATRRYGAFKTYPVVPTHPRALSQ